MTRPRFYRLSHLAKLADVDRRTMARMLAQHEVAIEWLGPGRGRGGIKIVWLAELERKMPDLLRSDQIARLNESNDRAEGLDT